MTKIDAIGRKILHELSRDGRISNLELAERVGLSPSACLRRVQELERSGVIKGYRAVLDPASMDIGFVAYVTVGLGSHTKSAQEAFERAVSRAPQVRECHNITGEADFLLKVVAKDLDDYSRFVERVLRQLPGVLSIRSSISLREIKAATGLPVLEILST